METKSPMRIYAEGRYWVPESELAEAYERAAKVCESVPGDFYDRMYCCAIRDCAAAIRALKANVTMAMNAPDIGDE